MVKLLQVFPFFGRMAGQAPQRLTSGAGFRHPLGKLSIVNILVTTSATESDKMI
jgi:hypothetical protein